MVMVVVPMMMAHVMGAMMSVMAVVMPMRCGRHGSEPSNCGKKR
jgi:hypothetical protein